MFNALRRLIQRYGFFRREHAGLPFDDQGSIFWYNDSFYTEEKRRNERLAQIARERAWVYANKDELLSKRKGFYVRLRALKNAEMAVEQGKPEPGK